MALPAEGQKAPEFEAPASNGLTVALKDFKGKNVVLYFYPKDDTPGCTVEACGFRDVSTKTEELNAVVLGVSPDGLKSHQKFIKKHNLPFILLADEDKKICGAYGVWQEKSMWGRKYMGVVRTTFIIDAAGRIVKIFENVSPKGHDQEVIQTLQLLG